MTFEGILGLLVLALIAGGAGVAVHALIARLKWSAYVQLWLTLAAALFVFELLVRSGLVVKPG
jgi:hypothetical protein